MNSYRSLCARLLLLTIVAVTSVMAQNQVASAGRVQKSKGEPESFIHRLLRICGIAAAPSTLKGPGDELKNGQIWIIDLSSGKRQQLTESDAYRSPVFVPASNDVLALEGTNLVRLSLGADARKLYPISGVNKLVGFSVDNPDELLLIRKEPAAPVSVELLSLSTGKRTPLPYDAASSQDRSMLEHLQSWDRTYDSKSLYVKHESKVKLSGTAEWTDVYFKDGAAEAVNVSKCDGSNCGQPSLSADGRKIVFVMEQ
ncbi:MAG TPA: hypothetical protein VJA94_00880 [Candidatus Angelobacter sp.]